MTVLVGLPRNDRAAGAVHLGKQLARTLGHDLLVCTVQSPPWLPGAGRIDAEYQEHLDRSAAEVLDTARKLVPPDVSATYLAHPSRSTAGGLLQVAEQHDASVIVVGSSSHGMLGRVAFGSVGDRLLHSSPIPVALAPRGYRCGSAARISRVTVAFGGTEGSTDVVVGLAGVAASSGGSLRIASFAISTATPLTAAIGSRAEAAVVAEWTDRVQRSQLDAVAAVEALPRRPEALERVVGTGSDWTEAIEDAGWGDGDLLAVGSSATGPLERVFIGSRASKIIRHSPVPVVAVPRDAVAALAGMARLGD